MKPATLPFAPDPTGANVCLLLTRLADLREHLDRKVGEISSRLAGLQLGLRAQQQAEPQRKQADEPLPDMLSAKQIARILGISVRTVWRQVQRHQLPRPVQQNRRLVQWPTVTIRNHVGRLTDGDRPVYP